MAKFIYAYDLDGGERRTAQFTASALIAEGVPVALTSGKITKATANDSALVGISVSGIANGAKGEVITNRRAVFKCEYKPGSKTSLTDADIGTTFDYDPTTNKIDLDDTSGGFLTLVDYNNEGKYAWVVIADTARGL